MPPPGQLPGRAAGPSAARGAQPYPPAPSAPAAALRRSPSCSELGRAARRAERLQRRPPSEGGGFPLPPTAAASRHEAPRAGQGAPKGGGGGSCSRRRSGPRRPPLPGPAPAASGTRRDGPRRLPGDRVLPPAQGQRGEEHPPGLALPHAGRRGPLQAAGAGRERPPLPPPSRRPGERLREGTFSAGGAEPRTARAGRAASRASANRAGPAREEGAHGPPDTHTPQGGSPLFGGQEIRGVPRAKPRNPIKSNRQGGFKRLRGCHTSCCL